MFRNQKFTTIFKSLIIVAIFFSCYSVTLAAWTAPTDTPPACNPATPGCNPPVNVSVVKQTKPGILGLGISELIPNFLSSLGVTPIQIRNYFAGFSNRIISESNFLNIFGHGTSPEREVKIWDNLTVPGDIRANNYYICSGDGTNCNLLGGTTESLWSQNGSSIYYNSGNVGIGTSNPSTKLEIGGVFKLAPQSLATDPAGTNGMIYYNQTMRKFRCYEDGSWFNCFSSTTLPPPTTYTLTITKAGTGDGTFAVTPTGTYAPGTRVMAMASASTGSVFAGWSGDCSGTGGTIDIIMDRNKSCVATFNLASVTCTLGSWVTGSCETCSGTDPNCTQVCTQTRTVTPAGCDTTSRITTRSCTGGACIVPISQYSLTIAKTGAGSGTVAPGVGSHSYGSGRVVNLEADPNTGSTFAGWSGDSDCNDGQVTMNNNKTCTARFNSQTFNLSITKSGTGDGWGIRLNSAGISLPYSASRNYNDSISITHNSSNPPMVGGIQSSFFNGFSGACSGASCPTFFMTGNKSVVAEFVNVRRLKTTRYLTGFPPGYNCSISVAGCDNGYGNNEQGKDYFSWKPYGQTCALTKVVSGYSSSAWGGDCASIVNNTCYLIMNNHKSASISCSN